MNPWLEFIWFFRRVRREIFWWNHRRQKVKAQKLIAEKLREDRQKFLARQVHLGKVTFHRGNRSRLNK